MNLTPGQAHEAYVGPPSETVEVSAFVDEASDMQDGSGEEAPLPVFMQSGAGLPASAREAWISLPQNEQQRITSECCVDDLRASLEDAVKNPRLMGHVARTHEATVHAIYETADSSNKRKRKRTTLADPSEEHPEAIELRKKLEATKLKCWPLTVHAASFIRTPRQPDHNTLIHVKKLGTVTAKEREALIFVTVYNRQSWGQRILSRCSQHVFLSSQTLGDLFGAIPCTAKEFPEEVVDDAEDITGYNAGIPEGDMAVGEHNGAAMCIEDVLYGDGQAENDSSQKLLSLCDTLPEGKKREVTKGPSMGQTKWSSLTFRLHEPYWVLHAGNCEHFFCVTKIRLWHPADPASGYPLTTQITPPLSEICRVCTKVPAVYSIVGDIRLGESPYLICEPCWRWMGEPKDEEVLVVPLPGYKQGWISRTPK
ncbi:snRNA-activating protein of 50kDa MW C terminal-domain-containing protein [Trametes meyenii]|nr:snRNA-activating protein of 50kDa MW C terminal-domain-containing protein [Trametes meyenii]